MKRYNSFSMIHKALRAMMYDTALTLQQTYFADAEETQTAVAKMETVIEQFEKHAYHEDTFMLPAIEPFEPELVEAFEQEHVEDIELGNRLKTLLNLLDSAESGEEKIICGSCINKSFRDFMIFNAEHMAKEESLINQALWKRYTDKELIELNAKLTAGIPPEEKMLIAKWMLRGLNKVEIIDWLKAVRQTAPSFVFQSLFDLAKNELPVLIFAEVRDGVLETEMVN